MSRTGVVVSGVVAVCALTLAGVLVTAPASPRPAVREVVPLSTSAESSTASLPDDGTLRRGLQGQPPLTWVFVGDSITHGSTHTDGRRSFVEHFAERVRTELGRVDDVVINTGVSGDHTEDVLADFDRRVRRFVPDVVVVMLGTNDSVEGLRGRDRFRERLSRIVQLVRESGAVPVLQTPPAADIGESPDHADLGTYADLVREVAAAQRVVLVDHHAHWLDAGDGAPPEAWLSDPVHPDAAGHLELAHTLFRRLGILHPASPTGGADWSAHRAAGGEAQARA